jgi:hypothetical protein
MDFAELRYWLTAVGEYNAAVSEAIEAARGDQE